MKPSTKRFTFKPTCHEEVPADKFEIKYGYKDESSIQIRFQGEGEVYASVFPNGGAYNARSATVPFKLFVDEFYEFLAHLNAKHHEMQEKAKEEAK